MQQLNQKGQVTCAADSTLFENSIERSQHMPLEPGPPHLHPHRPVGIPVLGVTGAGAVLRAAFSAAIAAFSPFSRAATSG